MKAEFRIGNYAILKGKEIKFTTFYGLCNLEAKPELYEPIPLSEEWLLKFGFVQCIHDKTLYKYLNFIYFKLEKEFNNSKDYDYISANLRGTNAVDFMCRLYFVHQLQNLYFALTGEELTIIKS